MKDETLSEDARLDRGCFRKQSYLTRQSGKRRLREMRQKGGYNGRVYRCPFCTRFHIGRPPKRRLT